MIWEFIFLHPYLFLFVGLIIGGEAVLLPALYFGVQETLITEYIWGISLLAMTIADLFWYFVGRTLPLTYFANISFFKKRANIIHSFSQSFKKYGLLLIFFSKFVYGTRTAAQLFAGSTKIPFIKYFLVNTVSLIVLNAVFTVLAYTVSVSLEKMQEYIDAVGIGIAIFIALIIAINIIIKRCFSKKILQQ
jgi:membrane protein DedA with SNARE-associated domain